MYKYNIGDLVFASNPKSPTNAGILCITEREIKRFDEDIISHRYYHGFEFGIARDCDSGLYVPLHTFNSLDIEQKYATIWSPNHRQSELEIINSKKIDLQKLIPYIRFLDLK
jgi:hypothetical protein